MVAAGICLLLKGDVLGGMWVVLLGWLLTGLAEGAYRAILVRTALEGLRVKDLCARDVPALQTSDTVSAAGPLVGAGGSSRVVAVMFGDRLAGVVSDVDVARLSADEASATPISAIMLRTGSLPTLDGEQEALTLPQTIAASPLRAVIVLGERGEYLGVVRHEDVERYVEMIEDLGNSASVSTRTLKRLAPATRVTPSVPNPKT